MQNPDNRDNTYPNRGEQSGPSAYNGAEEPIYKINKQPVNQRANLSVGEAFSPGKLKNVPDVTLHPTIGGGGKDI